MRHIASPKDLNMNNRPVQRDGKREKNCPSPKDLNI